MGKRPKGRGTYQGPAGLWTKKTATKTKTCGTGDLLKEGGHVHRVSQHRGASIQEPLMGETEREKTHALGEQGGGVEVGQPTRNFQ